MKILEVAQPIITSYTQHAHLLTILCTCSKTYEWIYSNYIQVYIDKELLEKGWGDFYFPMPYEVKPAELCKWVRVYKFFDKDIYQDYEDITLFVKKNIDMGRYVNMSINYKYITNDAFVRFPENHAHDALIYGYNDEKELFYLADFSMDNSKYIFFTVSYYEFRKACDDFVIKTQSYMNHYIYTYKL